MTGLDLMIEFLSTHNILALAAAGLVLLIALFALRGVFKLAWKVLRVGLILFAIAIIAGAFLGYLDISLL
jgi:hypothetical protein